MAYYSLLLLVSSFVLSCGQMDSPDAVLSDSNADDSGTVITVANYNVENFFDQLDDSRNASYGDYRIKPNKLGQYSNYGDPLNTDDGPISFTEVKARNVRQVLEVVKPGGPEVVGLNEIESQRSLDSLLEEVSGMNYIESVFSGSLEQSQRDAIGSAILSKYPIRERSLLSIPAVAGESRLRPILKVRIDVEGHDLYVYVNHWKSKAGPESLRMRSARVLEDDINCLLERDPEADYVLIGDFNSNYNENEHMDHSHNDTDGQTGINTVIRAQGDKSLLRGAVPAKYNLLYEVPEDQRRTEYTAATKWTSFDQMIIGNGMADKKGLTYVDRSFTVPQATMSRFEFLFNKDGTTKRWKEKRAAHQKYTEHEIGGYSDHVPVFASFRVAG